MSFAQSLSVKAELEKQVNKVARMATFFIDQNLILETPFDTGEAKGSWQVSANTPITSDNDVNDVSGSLTISKAKAFIDSNAQLVYPTFYIRSNKPYMEKLNNGYSDQAPKPFVDAAIIRGLNATKSITF
jgi:hypothetical protein